MKPGPSPQLPIRPSQYKAVGNITTAACTITLINIYHLCLVRKKIICIKENVWHNVKCNVTQFQTHQKAKKASMSKIFEAKALRCEIKNFPAFKVFKLHIVYASCSRLYLFISLQHFIGDNTYTWQKYEWVKLECLDWNHFKDKINVLLSSCSAFINRFGPFIKDFSQVLSSGEKLWYFAQTYATMWKLWYCTSPFSK